MTGSRILHPGRSSPVTLDCSRLDCWSMMMRTLQNIRNGSDERRPRHRHRIFRRSRAGKLRSALRDELNWPLHRGWVTVKAQVSSRSLIKRGYYSRYSSGGGGLGGYAVGFTYRVEGKSYEGSFLSPDKVEPCDLFDIRYNPRHPEQNNGFESETAWAGLASKLTTTVVALFLLFLLVSNLFTHR